MGIVISVKALWTRSSTGSHEFSFEQTRLVIGRARGSDVQLPHAAVSSTHATINLEQNGYVIVDEGSTNGTRVNDDRLVPGRPKPLRKGDRIDVGGFELHVDVGVPVAENTSTELTSALAKRMVRELLGEANERPLPQPKLTFVNGPDGGKVFELPPGPCSLVIGRAESCGLRLDDVDASRQHAEIRRGIERTHIVDLASKNGVLVNEKEIKEKRLIDRDQIKIGATELVFEDAASMALAQVEAQPDEEISLLPISEPAAALENPLVSIDVLPTEESAKKPSIPPIARNNPRRPTAEMLIYGLAGLVLIASCAAFYWLLRGQ